MTDSQEFISAWAGECKNRNILEGTDSQWTKIGGEKEISVEPTKTSPIVECDVCGRHFNRRYLSSHKRLSHKRNTSVLRIEDEAKAVETILALYLDLSKASRKNVIERLTSMSEPSRK